MFSEEEKRKIRLVQNEYHRKWRKENPEKVQAINNRFWSKKIQEMEQNQENGKKA